MQTLVEIGPSNASHGQHRRKDATEQIKNLTLARTRTQVPFFNSADAFATKLRVPVAEPEFFIPMSFQILNSHRCLPFMWTFLDMLLLCVFFIICPLLISLYNIAVLIIICRFELTLLLKYVNPCRNWTFQRIAEAAQKKGRNGTNEKSDTR